MLLPTLEAHYILFRVIYFCCWCVFFFVCFVSEEWTPKEAGEVFHTTYVGACSESQETEKGLLFSQIFCSYNNLM